MPVSLRALGATAALASCLALSACGGDDDSGKSLTKVQYDKLDKVFKTAVALDELPDSELNAGKYEEASAPYADACSALDTKDSVQVSVRATCAIPAQFAGQVRILGLCDTKQELCTDAVPAIRKLLAEFIRNGRDADKVLDDQGIKGSCLDLLKPSKLQYEVYQGYGRAFTVLQDAQTDQSKAGAEKAQKMIVETDEQAQKLPSARERLKAFESACSPS